MPGLADIKIRLAKPAAKPYRLYDERGLYIEIATNGSKLWRFKYRIHGKEKRLSLGIYPDVGLALARERRDDARKLVALGVDPSAQRKAAILATTNANANSFEVVAREWFEKWKGTVSPDHADKVLGRLENHVFPYLGSQAISRLVPTDLLRVLHRAESKSSETALRVRQISGQVLRYAVATGRAERDFTPELKDAIAPYRTKNFASITEPAAIGPLLRDLYSCRGKSFQVTCALKLIPHVMLRPGNLRWAEWDEFDFDEARWNIPAAKMKNNKPHVVPLSTQTLAIFMELRALTGNGQYVFSGRDSRHGSRPISENTLNQAIRSLGYSTKKDITGHGFRAMARTVLDEVLGFRVDWIEHQLAHEVRDANGRAYNRTAHLEGRREMMQAWSDYLDKLREEATNAPRVGR